MKSRLHIVIFDGSLKTTTFINRLIHGLASRHAVTVLGFNEAGYDPILNVAYVPLGSSDKSARLFWLSLGFAIKAFFVLGSLGLFFKSVRLLFGLQKQQLQQHNFNIAIQVARPDIVHVQWPSLLPWCDTLLSNPDIKVVLSQRGYQNNVRPFVDEVNFEYLQSVYPKIDGFHSVSKAMTSVSDLIYNSPGKIDEVVYSGFNFETLPFITEYQRNSPLQIISIGRPHWKKGYTYALKAMKLLYNSGVFFHYTIIGAKGDEELEYLKDAYNLNHHVTLIDKISQKEVYKTLQESDVFLLPSLEEGLPNVMIEAMAIGIPVIATHCGGVSECINATTGRIIKTRDAKAIADAILEFNKSDISDINKQRSAARLHVVSHHKETQMVKGMEALYFKSLKSSS